jgi:hypothetical protein
MLKAATDLIGEMSMVITNKYSGEGITTIMHGYSKHWLTDSIVQS